MPILETKRLILRPWQLDDLEDFHAYAKVKGVGEAAGWPPHNTLEDTEQVLKVFMATAGHQAIWHKQDQKVIGSLGVHVRDAMEPGHEGKKFRHLGFVLAKDYWGAGLMTEAVRRLLEAWFEDHHLDVMFCGHFDINMRSQRVVEKCGFIKIGEGPYESKLLRRTFNQIRYKLTRERYESVKKDW